MAQTLGRLKTILRSRIGEILAGTWGTSVTYQDEGGVDELALYLNQAQRRVVEDVAVQHDHHLFRKTGRLAVKSGAIQYALPADFLSLFWIKHRRQGSLYDLDESRVRLEYEGLDPRTREGTHYQYYSVEGRQALETDLGVATNAAASNTLLDNANTNFVTIGVKANVDTVENLTDGSSANVTAVAATQLTTDGLTGGKTNLFRKHDQYRVLSGDSWRELLWVFPSVSSPDRTEILAKQTGLTFTLASPAVLHSIVATLSAAPTAPLFIQLEDNASPGSPVQASDPESVAGVIVPASGDNTALFEYGIRLNTTTTYKVVVKDGNDAAVTPTHITVYGESGAESLEFAYSAYPRDMVQNTENCALPDWCHEAMLRWATAEAMSKLSGPTSANRADAEALYRLELSERVQRFERTRNNRVDDRIANVYVLRDRRLRPKPDPVSAP